MSLKSRVYGQKISNKKIKLKTINYIKSMVKSFLKKENMKLTKIKKK